MTIAYPAHWSAARKKAEIRHMRQQAHHDLTAAEGKAKLFARCHRSRPDLALQARRHVEEARAALAELAALTPTH